MHDVNRSLTPNYLSPEVPGGLPLHEVPIVVATAESLAGFGEIVTEHRSHRVEIVTWPQQGWRPVDPGTGDEGGTAEGIFTFTWEGAQLIGRNEAVDGHYVLGWSCDPGEVSATTRDGPREQCLLWHANYHPDGGQLFHPLDGQPFLAPLALPGDDIGPEDFVAFKCDGSFGLYIHPGVWHEAVIPLTDSAKFFDKQGRVHARVSCDFTREFGCLLKVPLVS
jgi:hypothetical protein